MKKFIVFISLAIYANSFAMIGKIYDTKNRQLISLEQFANNVMMAKYLVLGEFHNDIVIQQAEAEIIKKISKVSGGDQVSVMWEFLNYTDQENINLWYNKFLKNEITVEELLTNTSGLQNATYAEVLKASKAVGASLVGLNLPRELKQKVIKNGIESIDPKYIPRTHYLGGDHYLERFIDSMGGHVPSEQIAPYFLAQCLTDSVMADQIVKNRNKLNFIVAGSFHTDFYDATVEKMMKLTNEKIVTLKIINADNLDESELNYFINGDEKFGRFADFIVVTSEK